LSSRRTVSDLEGGDLVSGTGSITGGLATGDTLTASTSGTGITASYNASTGVMISIWPLSGMRSVGVSLSACSRKERAIW
jgi:hypothetical protein